ncbi:MAG: hypothetical protein ABH879_07455 [archaeon]
MFRYMIDTCFWVDLKEDRKGYNSEPLGEYALKLLSVIKADVIVVSDILIRESLENSSRFTQQLKSMAC